MTRLTNDIYKIVELFTSQVPKLFGFLFQFIIGFTTLFILNQQLAILTFVLAPISVTASLFIGRKLKSTQHKIQTLESSYRSYLNECIQRILILKIFNHTNNSLIKIKNLQDSKLHLTLKRQILIILSNTAIGLGYMISYLTSFIYGVYKIANNTTTFGTFTAYLQLVTQIQGPLEGLAKLFPQFIAAITSIERIIEIEKLSPEPELENIILDSSNFVPTGVKFDKLTFGYSTSDILINNQSLNIKPGETVGIIGHSGAGKTTLINLLLNILYPFSGTIELYNKNQQIISSLSNNRNYFTYVPQGNTLFSGTIAENLRIASPYASDSELENVLKISCCWDFINSKDNALNTFLGESGLGLSEGQAQRICIARALLKKAPILLLDEATSALDLETEKKVIENINNFNPNITIIAITHRVSILEICKKVYKLEKGILRGV